MIDRDETRYQVITLAKQRMPVADIADKLKISSEDVKAHIKYVKDQWQAGTAHEYDVYRHEQIATIDAVEAAAWEQWRKNQQPQLLATVLKCVELKIKIYGLERPDWMTHAAASQAAAEREDRDIREHSLADQLARGLRERLIDVSAVVSGSGRDRGADSTGSSENDS